MTSHTLPGETPPLPGSAKRVHVADREVAVFNVGGRLLGVDAACSHVGGPLEDGPVADERVTCPWHGSVFELPTGAVRRGPAVRPLRTYRVRAEANGLLVEYD